MPPALSSKPRHRRRTARRVVVCALEFPKKSEEKASHQSFKKLLSPPPLSAHLLAASALVALALALVAILFAATLFAAALMVAPPAAAVTHASRCAAPCSRYLTRRHPIVASPNHVLPVRARPPHTLLALSIFHSRIYFLFGRAAPRRWLERLRVTSAALR